MKNGRIVNVTELLTESDRELIGWIGRQLANGHLWLSCSFIDGRWTQKKNKSGNVTVRVQNNIECT